MASGVTVDDNCKCMYTKDLKLDKKYSYLLYRLSDDMKSIIVDKAAEPSCCFDNLKEDLLEAEAKKECRYAVLDFKYTSCKGAEKKKIIMISWAPDTAKIKQKMVHASSKEALKKALGDGISKIFQASEVADLNEEEIIKQLDSMDRT